MYNLQNFNKNQKNQKFNECHICWMEFKSSDLAFCSKRACYKAFCEKCIQDNFDSNYSIKKNYKKEYFICFVCQDICKCPFCIGTIPEKFGKRYISKFIKLEDVPPSKTITQNKKQVKVEKKNNTNQFNIDDEQEELFVFKGTKKSSAKIENQMNNDSNSFKYTCEESSTLENSLQQQKCIYQDDETKSPPTQSLSQFLYVKNNSQNENYKDDQQITEFECNNINADMKTTLNRILGQSILNEYDADNDLFEYIKHEEEIQQEDTTINNFSPIQNNQIIENIKFEEDAFCYKISQPLQLQVILPNVIEESDDSEEEMCVQKSNSNGIKKLIIKQKKNNQIIQNKNKVKAD
ncbi:hypothetical protein ABPG74_000225 [Tetrahymena malaccensis]